MDNCDTTILMCDAGNNAINIEPACEQEKDKFGISEKGFEQLKNLLNTNNKPNKADLL